MEICVFPVQGNLIEDNLVMRKLQIMNCVANAINNTIARQLKQVWSHCCKKDSQTHCERFDITY